MNDKLGNRRIYIPKGQDPIEDLKLLVDAIATSDADLFTKGGHPMVLKDTGELVGLGRDNLLEIISTYVVTKNLVNITDKTFRVEYRPVEPNEMTLRSLLKEESGLAARLPRMPEEPIKLSPQQQEEIRDRLKIGEPKGRVAAAYGTDIATIERMAAR